MLVIPETNTVFLFPPRTGSESLLESLHAAYPLSYLLYRHAEADAIPPGYENWRKIGFVRHPYMRLWSLYKLISTLPEKPAAAVLEAEMKRLLASVEKHTFEDWVLYNEELFISAEPPMPLLYQKHHIPETRKSQETTLRPDLGTVILKFQDLTKHMASWKLPECRINASPPIELPKMSKAIKAHMKKYFVWDMEQECGLI